MPSSTWSQTALLRWAPELRFYENRASILRTMEDQELLTAFRVGESEAGAQLGDPEHEIEFSHRDLVAMVRSPTGDVDRVLRGVGIVLEELRPSKIGSPSVSLQHVHPLDLAYDEARRIALASLFGSSEVGPIVAGDFANLIDGVAAEPAATFAVEYGVVSAEELPHRLSRTHSRMPGPGRRPPSPPPVITDAPAVALFVEAKWTLVDPISDENAIDGFSEAWQACRQVSDDFTEALVQRLFGLKDEREDLSP